MVVRKTSMHAIGSDIFLPPDIKDAKEISKVLLIKEYRLLGISSGGEVINCSGKLYPSWSGHGANIAYLHWQTYWKELPLPTLLYCKTPYCFVEHNI